ncbi:hypothetical protein QQ045_017622 [Rhodiola kirilowii]
MNDANCQDMSVPKGSWFRKGWNSNKEKMKSINEFHFQSVQEYYSPFPECARVLMSSMLQSIILRLVVECKSINEFHFQSVRANVDLLKLIQLGLTFSDADGNLPTCGTDQWWI